MDQLREETERRIRLGELRQLAREFHAAGGKLEGVADQIDAVTEDNRQLQRRVNTLSNALGIQDEALREEQRKNQELQRELAELRGETPQEKPLVVFIDHSISMSWSERIKTVLEATMKVSKSGVNLKAVLWSGKILRPVDLTSADDVERHAKQLSSITDFEPVVRSLETRTSASPDHFVIVNDGDLPGASDDYLSRVMKVLKQNPDVTLDFMLTTKISTEMERFAHSLWRAYPRQVAIKFAETVPEMIATLTGTAAERTGQPEGPVVQPVRAPAYRHG